MSRLVVDTHVLIWYLLSPERLSPTALRELDAAEAEPGGVVVPAVALGEAAQLARLGRHSFSVSDYHLVEAALADEAARGWRVEAFGREAAAHVVGLPASIRDPGDLFICATALELGVPLVTKDREIRTTGAVPVVW
jgi:PIN domain nuclease of toxin-antitoxin system